MPNPLIGRRLVLQAGLAAAVGVSATTTANASGPEVLDLGPAVVQFALMSGVTIGDIVYVGSRNLEPATIIAVHLPTGKVIGQTALGTGYSIQALAADPSGPYLYAGVLQKAASPANLYRWDTRSLDKPAEAVGRIDDRDVRDLAVAPDGVVYAVGSAGATAPALWQYDPATGTVSNLGIPDANSTTALAVAATDSTVFFGAGSTLSGGGSASRASLFAYDRSARTFTLITPPELQRDPSVRELAVLGDKLVVGSAGGLEPSKVALLDLADVSSYSVATSIGKTAKKFAAVGTNVYFANESSLLAYDTTANTISPVEFDGPALGEIWGVDARNGTVVVTSAFGFLAEIDPQAKTSTVVELAEAGAPLSPQTVMGIAAGGGYVYVGGTGTIARHTLRNGDVLNLRAPGEAKDAVVVDHVLFTGQYSSEGIWRYDPRDGAPIRRTAAFPAAQDRPLDVAWDAVNGLVLVGVQADTEGGGSFWTYDRRTERTQCFVNPIDAAQCVRAVATRDGVAYLGGDNGGGAGPRSTIVAFDPVAGRELWRLDPQQTAGVAALATRGRHLYGLSRAGGLFVVDLPTRKVIHRADVRSVSNGFAAVVTNRGVVYGASDTTVFRIDPKTFAVSTVVAGINGAWYSGPHITNDESGHLYTMRARNLVRITDS
ncbi:outer membrane protein assembly factor BamB family protein [Kribbella sp. NPDC054772]